MSRLVLGRDKRIAVRIRFGFFPMLLHAAWAVSYASAAHHGEMSVASLTFMIGTNLIGILTFYPLVRSGLTRELHDPGLVLAQMLWATLSTVCGMAMAPTLRPTLFQVLCIIQVFGFFSLKPAKLLLSGSVALALLGALFSTGASGLLPRYDAVEEIVPTLLTAITLVLLTLITIDQSRRRGLLVSHRAELGEAVAAVQELVIRDALTGLYNRRHMESVLVDELARSRASGVPFSIALLDIDHFKRINDGYGHATGDLVLRDFAQAIGSSLRDTDHLARWGGEEFLVLAPGVDPELVGTLLQPLQRLREAMSPRTCGRPAMPTVTFSAGLSVWRREESAEQTIARADAALYAAKAAGRDRLVVHETTG